MNTKPNPPQCPIHNCVCSTAYRHMKCRCDACVESKKESNRDYKERNLEACRAIVRRWKKDNREHVNASNATRKANMKISDLPPEEQERIRKIYKKAQEFKDQGLDVHVDHVIPVSKGGKTTPDNLAIISAEDNQFKSNKEISSRTATHMIVEDREIEILYPHY